MKIMLHLTVILICLLAESTAGPGLQTRNAEVHCAPAERDKLAAKTRENPRAKTVLARQNRAKTVPKPRAIDAIMQARNALIN